MLSLNREVTLWFQYDRKAVDENVRMVNEMSTRIAIMWMNV